MRTVTKKEFVDSLFPARKPDANKGSIGEGMIVAGSYSMPGAAVIAATGAVNTGIGLCRLAFPDSAYGAVTSHLTEPVLLPCKSDENGGFSKEAVNMILGSLGKCSAVAAGCGTGTGNGARAVTEALIRSCKAPLILDADVLNIIAQDTDILLDRAGKTAITPHPGEMARLTGKSIAQIQADRENAAGEFAEKYGITVLLKGKDTVIATPEGDVFINPTGCPAMARGGCGDLLTGVALSFAAQGLSLPEALVAAAFIHGKAGEAAAEKYGEYCATVGRIAEQLAIG